MQTHGFLQYAVVLLLAAVIAVPLAKRWQLGAVLGYLAAGALIGPSGIRLIGNTEQISQISELGVVLMLFVIGMELSPQRLWVMRRTVFGIGSLQLAATIRKHADGVARAYVKLFVEQVWKPFEEAGAPEERWPEVRDALERLRPLAADTLLAIFGVAMADASEEAFGREMDRMQRRRSRSKG